MRVVITGAFGFIGATLTRELLSCGCLGRRTIHELVLADRFVPDGDHLVADERVRIVRGDLTDNLDELFRRPSTRCSTSRRPSPGSVRPTSGSG